MYHDGTRSLQAGIARRQPDVLASHRDLWHGLIFAVPFKGGNWSQLAQHQDRQSEALQNAVHEPGLFGSSYFREVGLKSFASYWAGVQQQSQYTFTYLDSYTLAWAVHPIGVSAGATNYWILGGHNNISTFKIPGGWSVFQPYFTWNLRYRIWTKKPGNEAMTWNMLNAGMLQTFLLGTHTFSIRKIPGVRACELHIDGISLGTRTYNWGVDYQPFLNARVTVGARDAHPTVVPGSWRARWDAVCIWDRYLADEELAQWHANPLGMFTPARRRMPTPPQLIIPPEPPDLCDWFDPQSVATWLQTQAGQGWLATQAGQGWLATQAEQGWLTTQAGQGWLAERAVYGWLTTQAGQIWLQTQAGQIWLQTQAGQIWLQTQAGQDWATPVISRDWFADKECN